jgi:hypothetical protein
MLSHGLPSKKKSLSVRSVAPTAIVSRLMKESAGGDLGEVEKLRVRFLSTLLYHDSPQR